MAWTFYNSNGEALVQHAESEATQAEMEAETAVAHFVPPDLVKHSPGVAKAWCRVGATGGLGLEHNVSASARDADPGDYSVTFDTDFSATDYTAIGTVFANLANAHVVEINAEAVGVVGVLTKAQDALANLSFSLVVFGDQ
jgi:hypothetical protein